MPDDMVFTRQSQSSPRVLPRSAQLVFRGDDAAASLAAVAFGVPLSPIPCRANRRGDRAALWLGPDEWLLLAPEDQHHAIEAGIAMALAETPYAVVGVGHRQIMIMLQGACAANMLRAGCPLDLDPTAFPIGMCTRTVLAKAEIILWRTGEEEFIIIAWRSFTPYVREFLVEARTRL